MNISPRIVVEENTPVFEIVGKRYNGSEMYKHLRIVEIVTEDGDVWDTTYTVVRYGKVRGGGFLPMGARYFSSEASARKYFNSKCW